MEKKKRKKKRGGYSRPSKNDRYIHSNNSLVISASTVVIKLEK